jgi:archaellum component FlaC
MDDISYMTHMFEEMRGELRAVHEGVGAIREELARVPKREEFEELKQDVKLIKAAVGDLSRDLAKHKSLPAHVAHGRA